MPSRLSNYCLMFHKMFFMDKFKIHSNFDYPILKSFIIKIPFLSDTPFTKVEFSKLILLFYLLSGQKPKILITYCNTHGVKKVQISGLILHSSTSNFFFKFLLSRSLPITSQFTPFEIFSGNNFNFFMNQKTQDDDILCQVLNLSFKFSYQILMQTQIKSKDYLKTSLISLKIPCKLA